MELQIYAVLIFVSLVLISAAPSKEKKTVKDKSHEWRGLIGPGYGSDNAFGHDSFSYANLYIGYGGLIDFSEEIGEHQGNIVDDGLVKTITIHKTTKIPLPHPVPVSYEKKILVPVPVKVSVPVKKPYLVSLTKSVPVGKPVPYSVEKKVLYHVQVFFKVPVVHPIAVPVHKPVPYPVDKPLPYPVTVSVITEKREPVFIKHGHNNFYGDLEGGLE